MGSSTATSRPSPRTSGPGSRLEAPYGGMSGPVIGVFSQLWILLRAKSIQKVNHSNCSESSDPPRTRLKRRKWELRLSLELILDWKLRARSKWEIKYLCAKLYKNINL